MPYYVQLLLQVPAKPGPGTVRNVLRRMGMVSRKVVFKPLLRQQTIRKRRIFAQQYRKWPMHKWARVIFSDEKLFRVRPGAHVRCWRPKSAKAFQAQYTCQLLAYFHRYVHKTVMKAQALMVWCAIDGTGRLFLLRCPAKINAAGYQGLLGQALTFIKRRCLYQPVVPSTAGARDGNFNKMVLRPIRRVQPKRGWPGMGFRGSMGGSGHPAPRTCRRLSMSGLSSTESLRTGSLTTATTCGMHCRTRFQG